MGRVEELFFQEEKWQTMKTKPTHQNDLIAPTLNQNTHPAFLTQGEWYDSEMGAISSYDGVGLAQKCHLHPQKRRKGERIIAWLLFCRDGWDEIVHVLHVTRVLLGARTECSLCFAHLPPIHTQSRRYNTPPNKINICSMWTSHTNKTIRGGKVTRKIRG